MHSEYISMSGGASDAPKLIWTCCIYLHKIDLQPQSLDAKCSYEQHRMRTLRSFFDTIAINNYGNITRGLVTTCMSWGEMRDIVRHEEHHFLASRVGTNKPRTQHYYE